MNRKYRIYVTFLIMTFLLMMPIVQSVQGKVIVEDKIEISSDPHIDENSLINLADEDNDKFTNYELFWKDWKDNHSVDGVTASTMIPPTLVEEERDDYLYSQEQHIGVNTRFSHSQIMQGSSKHWWRSPFSVDEYDYDIRLRLYRVTSASDVNISLNDDIGENFAITEQSKPTKVFDSNYIDVTPENLLSSKENMPINTIDSNDEYINTHNASTITDSGVMFSGNVSFDEDERTSVNVRFEYRKEDETSWSSTDGQTVDESSQFKKFETGLDYNESYEYRAVYIDENGDDITGDIKSFQTKYKEKDIHSNKFISETQSLPSELTNESSEDVEYNFDYIKANAPIYAEEDYFALWSIVDAKPNYLVSSDDVGQNQQYRTWEVRNRTTSAKKDMYDVDFDTGTTFSTGMSDYVGGDNANSDLTIDSGDSPTWKWKRDVSLENMMRGQYLNFNLPFLSELEKGKIDFSLKYKFYDKDGNYMNEIAQSNYYTDYILDSISYEEINKTVENPQDVEEVGIELNIGKVLDDISETVYLGERHSSTDMNIKKLWNHNESEAKNYDDLGDLGHNDTITDIDSEDDYMYSSDEDGKLIRYNEQTNTWTELWRVDNREGSITVNINESEDNTSDENETKEDETKEETYQANSFIEKPESGDTFKAGEDIDTEVYYNNLNDNNGTDTRLVVNILENDTAIRRETETLEEDYDTDSTTISHMFEDGVYLDEYESEANYDVQSYVEDYNKQEDEWYIVNDSEDKVNINVGSNATLDLVEPSESQGFWLNQHIESKSSAYALDSDEEYRVNFYLMSDSTSYKESVEYTPKGSSDNIKHVFMDGIEDSDYDSSYDYSINAQLEKYNDTSDSWENIDNEYVDILPSETPTNINGVNELEAIRWNTTADYTIESSIDAYDSRYEHETTHTGSWDNDDAYFEDDIVEYDGNDYLAINPHHSKSDNHPTGVNDENWTETDMNGGENLGFHPIAEYPYGDRPDSWNSFSGTLDGKDHQIQDLFIDRPAEDYVGLFSMIDDEANVSNINMIDCDITGDEYVGGIVGYSHYHSKLNNSHLSGTISGDEYVGGAVGYNYYSSTIVNVNTSGEVFGDDYTGGLVGYNRFSSKIEESYSTSNLTGNYNIGGLVGYLRNAKVTTSYAQGNVDSSSTTAGGLVGQINTPTGHISTINKSYSTTEMIDDGGGLVGFIQGDGENKIEASFWDMEASETTESDAGIGKSTAEMQDLNTYKNAGWDIEPRWGYESSYPYHGNSWTIDQPHQIMDISVYEGKTGVVSTDGGVYIIDDDGSEEKIDQLSDEEKWGTCIEYHRDKIIVGTENGSIYLYDSTNGNLLDKYIEYHEDNNSINDIQMQYVDRVFSPTYVIEYDFMSVAYGEVTRGEIVDKGNDDYDIQKISNIIEIDTTFTSIAYWSSLAIESDSYAIVGQENGHVKTIELNQTGDMSISQSLPVTDERITDLDFMYDEENKYPINNKFYFSSLSGDYGWIYVRSDSLQSKVKSYMDVNLTALNVKRTMSYKPLDERLHFWMYDFNNNYTNTYKYSSTQVEYNDTTINYGFQIWHSIAISNGRWVNKKPTSFFEFRKVDQKRDTGIMWNIVLSVVSTVGEIARETISTIGDLPPVETLREWIREGAEYIDNKISGFLGKVGSGIQKVGATIEMWGEKAVDAVVYYGSALISLGIMAFSIFAYIGFNIIVIKTCFGMIILVTQGTDAMFQYYEHFMDNIIGLSKEAKGMLPVL